MKKFEGRIKKETQIRFNKTLAVPTLLYGSETCSLGTTDESRTESAEVPCSRRVM
jgi:hypothetical protein